MTAPESQSSIERRRRHRGLWWTLGILGALALLVAFFNWIG